MDLISNRFSVTRACAGVKTGSTQANSAFHPRWMSSKLIQMCIALLRRRHLVNAYEVNYADWLIP